MWKGYLKLFMCKTTFSELMVLTPIFFYCFIIKIQNLKKIGYRHRFIIIIKCISKNVFKAVKKLQNNYRIVFETNKFRKQY